MGRTQGNGHSPQQGRTPVFRVAATAAFLGFSGACAVFPQAAAAQTYSFSEVSIQGNTRVDAATILAFAGIVRGETVSAGQLNDAYQRIAASGLFETVEIDPQGRLLVIRVVENPIVNLISFEGNSRLKDEVLAGVISTEARRVFSAATAEADAAAITTAYRQAGRIAATVEPRIIRRPDNIVDLVFEITEGQVVEVERLSFVGNRAFSDRRLRQVLETKQAGFLRTFFSGDTFVAERLDLDKQLLRDFYASRGFVDFEVLDATAELSRERDGFFVSFSIREGQQFKVGAVSTISEVPELDAAEFNAALRLRPGVIYSPLVIDNNITRLENLALRKGLRFVRAEPRITRNPAAGTIDVQFALVAGERVFVERIDIEGNTTTLDQVVRRQFRTVEGDPFNPREVRQAAERIRALGFFSASDVTTERGSADDQVLINVDVEEAPTGSLGFGASFSVSDGVGLNASLSESNFLGRGQGLSLSISGGTDQQNSSFNFTEPGFLGRDVRLRVFGSYRQTSQANANYDTRQIDVGTGLEFPVSLNGRLEVRYSLGQDEITSVSEGSSAIIQREAAEGAETTSQIGYTYSFDTRREGLNPNGGLLLRFGQNFAGLGGDVEAIETTLLALAERRIFNEEVTLRASFEGGVLSMLSGDSRVTTRFFGNGKVRGFETNGYGPRDLAAENEDALGGNYFAAARFEAEFPLGTPEEYGLKGGVFLDVGSVWSLDDTSGTDGVTVDDDFSLRSAIGVSLFWTSAIGPLRFNFTHALSQEDYDEDQAFDFTIATQF